MRNIRRPLVKMLLVVFPCFMLWQSLCGIVILPFIQVIGQTWLGFVHADLHADFVYVSSTSQWMISAPVFLPSYPYADNAYVPDLSLTAPTSVNVNSLELFSLGFPVIWLTMVILGELTVKRLLISTAILTANLILVVIVFVSLNAVKMVDTAQPIRILYQQYVTIPYHWPDWVSVMLKPIAEVVGISAFVVTPALLILFFLKETFRYRSVNE